MEPESPKERETSEVRVHPTIKITERYPEETKSGKLNPTVYNIAVLLFVRPDGGNAISPVDSIVTMILCTVNIFIQVLFVAVIFAQGEARKADISGEAFYNDALVWRVVEGHHADNYDPITNTSLVTRVCARYGGEASSQNQMASYAAITRYLDGFGGPGYGWLLSLLAILMWTTSIATELRAICHFFNIVLSAKTGSKGRTLLVRDRDADGKLTSEFVLEKISHCRRFIMGLGALLRFGIAALLWWAGVLWLTYEIHLDNVILNCVALGFVLSCDEALFMLVPKHIKRVQENLREIELHNWQKRFRTLRKKRKLGEDSVYMAVDYASLALVLGLLVTGLAWYFVIYKDFEQQLRTSQSIFCGGQQNFIYVQDPATKVIHAALTVEKMEKGRPDILDAVVQKTKLYQESGPEAKLREDLHLDTLPHETLYQTSDIADVRQLDVLKPEEAMNLAQCADIDSTLAGKQGMLIALGVDTCQSAKDEIGCGYWKTRTFCPITCRCHQVDSGIYNRYGCSSQCSGTHQEDAGAKRLASETNKECKDEPQSNQSRGWHNMFFEEVQEHLLWKGHLSTNASTGLTTFSTEFVEAASKRMGALEFATNELGEVRVPVNVSAWWESSVVSDWECRLVVYLYSLFQVDFCEATDGFGSLAPFCPRTCGWCGTAMPEVDLVQMAREFETLIGEPLLTSEKMDALEAATPLHACTRPSSASNESNVKNISRDEIHYLYLVQQPGRYTFRVIGSQGFNSHLSIWNARSLQQLYEHDALIGNDPCLKLEAQAGQELLIVIGHSVAEQEDGYLNGQVEFLVECPWHEDIAGLHLECPLHPAPREELDQVSIFSLQDTDCETAGLYQVLGSECEEAARQLGLVSQPSYESRKYKSWVPYGCSYDKLHQLLYVDGTGVGGGKCGNIAQCICSSKQRTPPYNRFASACNKDTLGACKACVEDVDPFCKDNPWDSLCDALCGSNCELLCKVPLETTHGPCKVEREEFEWCIYSDSYSSNYDPYSSNYATSTTCEIPLGLKTSYGAMRVESFDTERFFDVLTVNGIEFSGLAGPKSIVPTGTITWSSNADSPGAGWKICFTEDPCEDSAAPSAVNALGQDCAELAVSSWTCSTEHDAADFRAREMCCHCGGGIRRDPPKNTSCWKAGTDVAIKPGTRYENQTTWCTTVTSDICEAAGFFSLTWPDGHTGRYEYEDLKPCVSSSFLGAMTGPCRRLTDEATQELCITSDGHPSQYANRVQCEIRFAVPYLRNGYSIGPGEIRVEAFETETNYDFLYVNGASYAGVLGPPAVYPQNILWTTDGSVTRTGWRICTSLHDWSCQDSSTDCTALEAAGATCISENGTEDFEALRMCCYCGGGSMSPV